MTGSEKYCTSGERTVGPTVLAARSMVISTSGRRRANPRTYPSTSKTSLAKPERGIRCGAMSSVNIAGSRGDEP